MLTRGRAIFRTVNLRSRFRNGDESSVLRALSPANFRRKAANSWSAVQDTYFSTKEVFESHRVVFTVGTSIASLLTAWAGYSIRQMHQAKIERRLESIEESMKKRNNVEHEEIKKLVTSGNVSTTVCVATALTSLILGYSLGWRGGAWYANRKFRKQQLKLLGQMKPNKLQFLRRPFVRLRKLQGAKKTTELQSSSSPAVCSEPLSNSSSQAPVGSLA